MIIYILLALTPFFLEFFSPQLNRDKIQRKKYFVICGAIMLLVMGFRSRFLGSTDTLNYYNRMAMAIDSISWNSFCDFAPERMETGFLIFTYCLSRIFSDPQWIIIISSLFFIISIFYFVTHNSDDIALSLVIYLTIGGMFFQIQGMRQALAMSICLFAYEQAKRHHLYHFILLVLFASCFHQTAIIFFPVYYLCKLKYNWKSFVLLYAATTIIIMSMGKILSLANNLWNREYYSAFSFSGGFIACLIYILIFAAAIIYYHNNKLDAQTPLVFILYCGMICYFARFFGTGAAERISFYFIFAQVALISKIPLLTKSPREALVTRMAIIMLAIGLSSYRTYTSDFAPYYFCWQ